MKLLSYIQQAGLRPRDFASRISASERAVIKWLRRERRPSAEMLRRIYEATAGAVTANDFYDLPTGLPASPTTMPSAEVQNHA